MAGTTADPYIPGSDAPAETSDKAKALFGENYTRLQEVKQRYDPENVFNKWFAIAPKVSV